MAKNKGATVRYRALDRCLRSKHKKYGINDLIAACSQALTDAFSEPMTVSRRQIYDDLNYMESDAGFRAIIDHKRDLQGVYYRYADPEFSIEKMPLSDDEIDQLKETVFMLSRFKGMPHFEWMEEIAGKLENTFHLSGSQENVIGFEQNIDLKGLKYITPLFEAIVNSQVLTIQYQSFRASEPANKVIHPYYLKQYNNRWFLFGLDAERNKIINLALDRIKGIDDLFVPYIAKPTGLDFDEYFDDVVGVTIPEGKNVEHIVIQCSEQQYPYIANKPIHLSQHNYDDEKKVTIDVIPNSELIAQLLSFGSNIEVIEPQSVREVMAEHAKKIYEFYK